MMREKMKKLLSGNEAIARGAFEYGVHFAAAYPGTPSTEILENVIKYKEISSEWSVNEKVAYETAWGASLGGARTLVTMKHVGLNVAADPYMTSVYTGVNGGLVLVSADDPGMWSSQNEQDNRNYAKFGKVPMLEPSDSQEAKDFVGEALRISEEYDIPVILRITTRIAHSKSMVELNDRKEVARKEYRKDMSKYVMLPSSARARRVDLKSRLNRLGKHSNEFPWTRMEINDTELGLVVSGVVYQYAKEAAPKASLLKIAMTNPLPLEKIKEFAGKVKRVVILEELDPIIEEQVKAAGIEVEGKNIVPEIGELNVTRIREILFGEKTEQVETEKIPMRPPVLCPGCPHRGFFYVASRLKTPVMGDIGCYTLGAFPPLSSMDSCLCMGASVSSAGGMAALDGKKVIGVLGDSTFMHSGITGLINCVYNKRDVVVCVLDNRITAMTGHQVNPGTGQTISGQETQVLDLEKICRASGVEDVKILDAMNIGEIKEALKDSLSRKGVSVMIVKGHCLVYERQYIEPPYRVLDENCTGCGICAKIGCPAIERNDRKAVINEMLCVGCGLCSQVCNFNAFVKKESE